jgi:hypothetical protein
MNALVLAALTACASVGSVSLESTAVPLSRLGEELSAQTGQKLRVSPELGSEVVAVRFNEVDAEEALARLARAVDGKWIESGGARTLVPDTEAWRAEAERWRQDWREALHRRLGQWAEELSKAGPFDSKRAVRDLSDAVSQFESGGAPGDRMAAGVQRLMIGNPGGRAIVKFATALGADALARIGPGERAVFSTNPTRMQRPLPGSSAVIVREFLAEQRAWTSQLASSSRNGIGTFLGGGVEAQGVLLNGTPAKTFLVVTRPAQGDVLTLSLVVADEKGRTMANGFSFLTVERDGAEPSPAASADGAKVELSTETLEAAKLFAAAPAGTGGPVQFWGGGGSRRGFSLDVAVFGVQGGTPRAKTPSAWVDKLSDPVANEPLGWHVGEALLQAAKAEDRNLVAYLPDHLAVSVARTLGSSLSAGSVHSAFAAQGTKVAVEDGWTMVTPVWKAEARGTRVDRGALKALLQAGRKSGSFRLGDLAAYARTARGDSGLDSAIASLIDPAFAQDLRQVYGMNSGALKFFGLLGPAHRPMFGTGRPIALGAVGPQGANILYDLVFNSMDGPDVARPTDAGDTQAEVIGTVAMAGGRGRGGPAWIRNLTDMTRERTEALPNGIPPTVSFRVDVQSQPGVKAIESATGASRFMSARQLAALRAFSENANIPATIRRGPQWDAYVPLTETEFRITWEIAPGVTISRELSDRIMTPGASPVAYERLPAEFQNQVAQFMAQMSERADGRRGGGSGERRGRPSRPARPVGP